MCPHNHDENHVDNCNFWIFQIWFLYSKSRNLFAGEPKKYDSYLKTRPATMELEAIKMVGKLSIKYEYVYIFLFLETKLFIC